MSGPKIRVYVEQPLAPGQAVALDEGRANYLFSVMRLSVGQEILLFNGQDGEWRAELAEANKRRGLAICRDRTRPQGVPPDVWLVFSPVKKERTNFIVEKAVELGAARLIPVGTRHMNSDRFNAERHAAHAAEAAEQCEATWVPQVSDLQPLDRLLASWPADRRLFWADEGQARDGAGPGAEDSDRMPAPEDRAPDRGEATPATRLPPPVRPATDANPFAGSTGPAAILIGPEGGFSEDERRRLAALAFVTPFTLGPRILRAETAALAALSLWQAACGDWT